MQDVASSSRHVLEYYIRIGQQGWISYKLIDYRIKVIVTSRHLFSETHEATLLDINTAG